MIAADLPKILVVQLLVEKEFGPDQCHARARADR